MKSVCFYILVIIILLILIGCDNQCAHSEANCENRNNDVYLKTNSIYQYKIVCIDNKEFIEGPSRLAINLDQFSGRPIPCVIKTK